MGPGGCGTDVGKDGGKDRPLSRPRQELNTRKSQVLTGSREDTFQRNGEDSDTKMYTAMASGRTLPERDSGASLRPQLSVLLESSVFPPLPHAGCDAQPCTASRDQSLRRIPTGSTLTDRGSRESDLSCREEGHHAGSFTQAHEGAWASQAWA